ncbi:MAG: hypothetical protein U0S36_03765 [Candidatus Nanopelagicales bacterium]
MGIFEGEDETAVDLGRGSELSASVHHDLRLDPLRRAIGALLDRSGLRVGTVVTEVEVWFRPEGVLRRRDVDPYEVVKVEVDLDPVELDDDGRPVALPWAEASFEPDQPETAELLAGRLRYGPRDLTVRWFDPGEAARERLAWDTRFDLPDADPPSA